MLQVLHQVLQVGVHCMQYCVHMHGMSLGGVLCCFEALKGMLCVL